MLEESFPEDIIKVIKDEDTLHRFRMNKEMLLRRVYLVIPYENVTFITHAISVIQSMRSNKAVILLPQNLFEEITMTISNDPLNKILKQSDSYVSVIANVLSKYEDSARILSNSMSIIVGVLTEFSNLVSLCKTEKHRCLSKQFTYKYKIKMIKSYLRKKIAEKKLQVNLIYVQFFLKYQDVQISKDLVNLIRYNQAVVVDKDYVRVTSIHLKAMTFLQSPHVMIRNITNKDGCNTNLYGCECYLLNRKRNTKKKYCCFGISIDVINEIIKLHLHTKELQESLSGIKQATVEIIVLESDISYINGEESFTLSDIKEAIDPLKYLKNSEADLVVGSHVICSSWFNDI